MTESTINNTPVNKTRSISEINNDTNQNWSNDNGEPLAKRHKQDIMTTQPLIDYNNAHNQLIQVLSSLPPLLHDKNSQSAVKKQIDQQVTSNSNMYKVLMPQMSKVSMSKMENINNKHYNNNIGVTSQRDCSNKANNAFFEENASGPMQMLSNGHYVPVNKSQPIECYPAFNNYYGPPKLNHMCYVNVIPPPPPTSTPCNYTPLHNVHNVQYGYNTCTMPIQHMPPVHAPHAPHHVQYDCHNQTMYGQHNSHIQPENVHSNMRKQVALPFQDYTSMNTMSTDSTVEYDSQNYLI
eukprot:522434_1